MVSKPALRRDLFEETYQPGARTDRMFNSKLPFLKKLDGFPRQAQDETDRKLKQRHEWGHLGCNAHACSGLRRTTLHCAPLPRTARARGWSANRTLAMSCAPRLSPPLLSALAFFIGCFWTSSIALYVALTPDHLHRVEGICVCVCCACVCV